MWLHALQLFKNSIDTQEKVRLNLHSLSVSVSELLEYGRKSIESASSAYFSIFGIDREDFSTFWITFSVWKLSSLLGLFWRETREVRNVCERSVSCDTELSSANQNAPFSYGPGIREQKKNKQYTISMQF
jgi:hypothetical protein